MGKALRDGRTQETWDEGHRAGAAARRPAGLPSRGDGSKPLAVGWLQLGEPKEIRSPADVHGPEQLLLGDPVGWHCAQNYGQELIQ